MKKIAVVICIFLGLIACILVIGYMLPVSHIAEKSEILKSDSDNIYRILTDVKEYPSWRKDIVKIELVDKNHWIEHNTEGDKIEYKIEIIEPMKKWNSIILTKDLPYGGYWSFDLTKHDSASQLIITEHGEVYNPIFRFVSKFIIGQSTTIESYFKDLKTKLGE